MSKARITYRFENARPTNGQAAAEPEPRVRELKQEQSRTEGPAAAEAVKPQLADVIPLKHVEFQVSDEPFIVEEKPPEEKKRAPSMRLGSDFPYDYGAWNHRDGEAEELERLIRQTGAYTPEVRRGSSVLDEDLDLDREHEAGHWRDSFHERELSRSARHRTNDGPAWWKVAGSVVGAIATGVLFGSFVLNLFTGESSEKGVGDLLRSNQPGPVTDASQGAPAGVAVSNPDALEEAVEAETASIHLPERRMFLLQNGMFETLEAARTLANEMKGKGLAATIEEGERFFVYAGVTSNRDAALRAGVQLQAAGVEVYVKPYDLPPVQKVRWSSDETSEALSAYVAKGSGMVQMLGDLTLVHLEGGNAVAPEAETLAKVKSEHLGLTEMTAQATAGLPVEAQPMLKRMDDAVRNAVIAIEEYAANPNHAYLWSAQSALMDYIIAEKQLLTTIAAM
jgi:stage II sporulation protein B